MLKWLNFGLINWITSPEELEQKHKILSNIYQRSYISLCTDETVAKFCWQNKVTTQLELEAESFLKSVNSKDFKMAVRALCKRQPEFEGR